MCRLSLRCLASPVVARCRGGLGVTGQPLDGEDIDASGQEIRDAASAEVVRGERRGAGLFLAAAQDVGDRLAAHPADAYPAGLVDRHEQRAGLGASNLEPHVDQAGGAGSEQVLQLVGVESAAAQKVLALTLPMSTTRW